ncbi:Uncharacterized protein ChrSV_1644 [Chromobacterium vaccinii]|nr:Uncharacterized protein ChrSW_1644 [Chromobacterium vaccinii]QND89102.1 Uncharacterized protein ChrSV_1644 [Chromobacterium vaccinii]
MAPHPNGLAALAFRRGLYSRAPAWARAAAISFIWYIA